MHLDQDFREFIALLLENDVRFMVVGGYAVARHGWPRFTDDLDLWLWMDPTNASGVLDALREFGFGDVGLTVDDFLEEDQVVQLGRPPLRIDLLTGLDGVRFSDCHRRVVVTELDGLFVPFIGRDDLITNKRASGRPQDLADVAALEP